MSHRAASTLVPSEAGWTGLTRRGRLFFVRPPRSAPWRTLSVACCALLACSVYNEDLLVAGDDDDDDDVVGCSSPADCPSTGTVCASPSCTNGSCGVDNAPEATACSEGGGVVCDGFGSCVECVSVQQCGQGEVCSNNTCVEEGSLSNGEACSDPAACQSGVCVDDVCCADSCTGFCEACDVAGDAGSCTLVPAGADPDDECGDDACNGQGVCRCTDSATNGEETDQDCGGPACDPCSFGQNCNDGSDCDSGACAGTCLPLCGDTKTEGGEGCDDGNADSFDGCSATCNQPSDHLLLTEFVVSPTGGELIEIYNPTATVQALTNVYLADFNSYYLITLGSASAGQYDFILRFPAGATIASESFVVVSLESASAFNTEYGAYPDFDVDGADANAPAMTQLVGSGSPGLTNGDEMLVLFRWNGSSDLVQDLDYMVYGNSSDAMDKSGVTAGSSTYLNETPVAAQSVPAAPGNGKSLHRCETSEGAETQSGGNGITGHDETSEDLTATWKLVDTPTPKAAPASGFCP